MSKKAPYECVEMDEATKEERRKMWTGPASVLVDAVKTKPFGCLLGKKLAKMADPIYNFEVKPDDVWMISYPKAGSTWLQVRFHILCDINDEGLRLTNVQCIYNFSYSFRR